MVYINHPVHVGSWVFLFTHHGFLADACVAYVTVSSRCSGEGRRNLSWLSSLGNSRGEDINLTPTKINNVDTPYGREKENDYVYEDR